MAASTNNNSPAAWFWRALFGTAAACTGGVAIVCALKARQQHRAKLSPDQEGKWIPNRASYSKTRKITRSVRHAMKSKAEGGSMQLEYCPITAPLVDVDEDKKEQKTDETTTKEKKEKEEQKTEEKPPPIITPTTKEQKQKEPAQGGAQEVEKTEADEWFANARTRVDYNCERDINIGMWSGASGVAVIVTAFAVIGCVKS